MRKSSTFLLIILILAVTSCQKRILDKTPESFFVESDIWSDINLIKQFETNVYRGLSLVGLPGQADVFLCDFTDDARTSESIGNAYSINSGAITASSMGAFNGIWEKKYKYIRAANIFLSKIDNVDVGTDQEKQVLKGEVIYLRAAMYFDLINFFGGVPLITNVYTLEDQFNVKRGNYEDLVDWIVKQLDEAESLVPQVRPSDEWGRIDKGICRATKAEVLLYANSKLHNPNSSISGPLFDYTKNTWQECADAAKAVIEMPQYQLQSFTTSKEYHDFFLTPNPGIIFPNVNSVDHSYGTHFNSINGPSVIGGINETMALQNLVDQFEMKNGKFIDEPGSGYDSSPDNMYNDRDLRFFADITTFGRTALGALYGLAYPDGHVVNSKRTSTGYPVRKYLDPSRGIKDPSPFYARIRLANIYLIYAEAEYELGNESEARKYVNKIRNRVQLPDVTSSGEALFKDIQHERRIELCFEGQRFFDVRRWMIADSTGNEPDRGIILEKKDASGNLDPKGSLTYHYQILQKRSFPDKFYYLPVPEDEIQRSGIEQNPGY